MTNCNCSGERAAPTNIPLSSMPLAAICSAAREAGRNPLFLPNIDAINRNWVRARELWIDAHMPEAGGLSDDEYDAAINQVALAFEEGVDDLFRSLEESVSHE